MADGEVDPRGVLEVVVRRGVKITIWIVVTLLTLLGALALRVAVVWVSAK